MTKKELEDRVVELERRIRELEARPRELHTHYHSPVYQQPYTPPLQPVAPFRPYVGDPLPPWGSTTCVFPDGNGDGTITWSGGRQ